MSIPLPHCIDTAAVVLAVMVVAGGGGGGGGAGGRRLLPLLLFPVYASTSPTHPTSGSPPVGAQHAHVYTSRVETGLRNISRQALPNAFREPFPG